MDFRTRELGGEFNRQAVDQLAEPNTTTGSGSKDSRQGLLTSQDEGRGQPGQSGETGAAGIG